MKLHVHRALPFLALLTSCCVGAQAAANAQSESAVETTNWKTLQHSSCLTIRINPGADLSLYTGIRQGSVEYTGSPRVLTAAESDQLTSLFRKALTQDIAAAELADTGAGGRTLTLNAKITRVRRSHPWVNVLTTAAVFVPLDLGAADVMVTLVDSETGQAVGEIQSEGCGQIYQVIASFQSLGQSKLLLKKQSRRIARSLRQISEQRNSTAIAMAMTAGD